MGRYHPVRDLQTLHRDGAFRTRLRPARICRIFLSRDVTQIIELSRLSSVPIGCRLLLSEGAGNFWQGPL